MIPKLVAPAILLGALLASTGCEKKPVVDDGTQPFQGTWYFVEDGKKTAKRAIFEKDIFRAEETKESAGKVTAAVAQSQGSVGRSPFRVDAAQTPAHIDFICIEGDNQGKTRQGIFVFEGDRLKICVGDFDAPRPTEFAAQDKIVLMILERKPSP